MKLNKVMLAGLMAFGAVSAAHAHSGKITFEGQIVDTPCSILPGTEDQSVDFGTIALDSLTPGATSVGQVFELKLQGCDVTTATSAEVTFTGATGHGDTFGVTGTAQNIGILISGANGTVAPGDTDTWTLAPGNNVLSYTASVAADSATGNAVTAGNFSGVANYIIAYK